ncbi:MULTISPECIES: ATP-binding protein [unclassified Polaromonas]|jgi:hypothetical protein|uniref:AlbA family DNA-binding domain-containing protein n=1 Tax=unclassified Polaromonas TaxID=2638319 RepID=UPI000BD58AAB|nr:MULTISPECIES: ATP-binding protein [unclassified Polaromonas]OYY34494.1 MAG: hypothetical protein B7Y60_15500 [Polaromonas sp. 35-63-35]OYZ18821.1 MAG: hypothetical protein B7Y28_14335 [Polaromonas sp. 16-63-31]OYZ78946.1 MAG: hypothetical protein B7Y09_11790 [Polaromonas sp. 24-63-21]OZA49539.1 MAG: hypothetical protein B7X88_14040 [Polaromonas sp. 17-63-33]OZA86918.1 MAG: hypothetical protein B7X65_15780 [Polaromonas sp. 39-63-25]
MANDVPSTLDDIKRLITSSIPENLHLDYKRSAALLGNVKEITKDVSAFANSDGGVIVYGVAEEEHIPVGIDGGVEHSRYTREWLEDVIQSNIAPKLSELKITQLEVSATHSIFIVSTPKSARAPHQDRGSHRYYKRYNFKSAPMEDYEIQDIRNRSIDTPPLVTVDIEVERGMFSLYVENIGNAPAQDLTFIFSEDLYWAHKAPSVFASGIPVLSKGRKLSFFYAGAVEALAPDSKIVKAFSINVSYLNPLVENRISDTFSVNLNSFENSLIVESEIQRHGTQLERSLEKLTRQVEKVAKGLSALESVAGSTGLQLSATTWRHIEAITGRKLEFPRLNPMECDYEVFQELLSIERDLAIRLYSHFLKREGNAKLLELEGMTAEIKERLERYFDVK